MFIKDHDRNISRTPVRGFTLIEILVVIGMIGILAATVLVAVNPLHQFAQARNAQRISNVNAILNAIGNRIADNQGLFPGNSCPVNLPSTPTGMGNTGSNLDIRPCLVPNYISELPNDPSIGNNECTNGSCSGATYDTGYTVAVNSSTHRVTVCAPQAQVDGMSSGYCLSR